MTVVTRIPPSPTGFMHIGTARTALFNWLFAKHHGGKFLLRIEDTDRARHSEEAVQAIIDGLNWLELDWDGEPVSQFARQKRHQEIANDLLQKGLAYKCYCTAEELEDMRAQAQKEGRAVFYDRRWRDKSPEEAPAGQPYVVRIKSPIDGTSTVHDKVQGDVTLNNNQVDDFVLLRSDGSPTYMLAVVVDDYDMGVTHVIRGDDHLNNAFRQNVIYDAMGWEKPVYAHTPMINGPDGKKLSKRHGAQGVAEYKDMGFLPEAMRNYLLRLGWSHGDDEIISTQQAIEWFNLESIGRSPAGFDFTKLENLNAHYMKECDDERLLEFLREIYQNRHQIEIDEVATERIKAGLPELKDRAKTLLELADEGLFYVQKRPLRYEDEALKLLDDKTLIDALIIKINELKDFSQAGIQNICKEIAQGHYDGKLGKVAMPLRAVLTGKKNSPSVFSVAEILGKEEVLGRLEDALNLS